jgi:hypothetical protein
MFSLTFLTAKAETLRVETEENLNGFVAEVKQCLLHVVFGVVIKDNLLQFEIPLKMSIFFLQIQVFGDVTACRPIKIDVSEDRGDIIFSPAV